MKKVTYLVLGLAFLAFTGCEKETTEGFAEVTYYPIFEKSGDDVVFLEAGTPFEDPGIVAKEDGVEVDIETSFDGYYRGNSEFDPNVSDLYNISYTAQNKDGLKTSEARQVWVAKTGDLTTSIEGLYTATIVRNGQLKYSDVPYVLIWKNTDGTYGISCAIGAYYEYGVGYTPAFGLPFHAPITVTANDIATNDFSFGSTDISYSGWKGDAMEMKSLTVDAANKQISYVTDWAAGPFTFEVTLTQVQL